MEKKKSHVFHEISPNVFRKIRFADITRLHADVTRQIKQAAGGRKRQACIIVRVGHACNKKNGKRVR